MSWGDLFLAVLVCLLLLVGPGYLLARVVGLRGQWAFAAAAPFSVTTVGLASLLAPFVGLSWSIWPMLGLTVVLAGVLAALRWSLRQHWHGMKPTVGVGELWWVVGVALAAVILAVRMVQIVGEPGNISQTFDNIFHLNAVRYVLDTANGSSLHIGSMTSEGIWFYPAAWHATAALIVQITSVSIPIAVNALWMTLSIVAWPVSVLLLTRTLFGSSPVLLVGAGLVAASLPAFPILLISYGVLYPYHGALALLGVAVAALIQLMGLAHGGVSGSRVLWVVVLIGSLPGIALMHPGAFVAAVALSLPIVTIALVRAVRATSSRNRRIRLCVAFAGYAGVGMIAAAVLRPPADASLWPTVGSAAQALGEVAAVGLYGAESAVVAAVLMIIGVVVALRRRTPSDWAAVTLLVMAGFLYIVVAGVDLPIARTLFTSPWYNNTPRLAAIIPLLVVPLAGAGAVWLWAWIRERPLVRRLTASTRPWLRWGAVVATLAVVTVALQVGPMSTAVRKANLNYQFQSDSALLSIDEMALFERLPSHVPADAVIAGSPWTGAGLAYAMTGRWVLMPHTLMDVTPEGEVINNSLRYATQRPEVCAALAAEGVSYVLDFGAREVHGTVHDYPGLDFLSSSPAVELVDHEGDARLYKIVACG